MQKQDIINKLKEIVKEALSWEHTGHDDFHVFRVYDNAKAICEKEWWDMFIVECASLLHDIADYKLHNLDENKGGIIARKILEDLGVKKDDIEKIVYIIDNMSFHKDLFNTSDYKEEVKKELFIVMDADKLDSSWTLGIARTFAFWWAFNRQIYNPDIKINNYKNKDEYMNQYIEKENHHSINHFYDKLLKIKDMMKTETWRKEAEKRHKILEIYLEEFMREWNAKL